MINNILITGANGQDGKIIVNKLLKKRINLFLIAKQFKNKILKKNIRYLEFNLNEKNKLEKFFKKNRINTILHLASNNPSFGQNNFKKHYLENLNITKDLIDLSIKYNKKIKFISSSSSRIFKKKTGLVDEDSRLYISDFYSKFRIEIYNYLNQIKFKNDKNFNFTNAILFNHDSIYRNKRFLLPRIIDAILKKKINFLNKIIRENIVMDYSHADDICDGLIKIIFTKKNIKNIILSSGKKTHINDIIKFLIKKNKINLNLKFKNIKKNSSIIGNNKFAKKKINWKIKKNIYFASQELFFARLANF